RGAGVILCSHHHPGRRADWGCRIRLCYWFGDRRCFWDTYRRFFIGFIGAALATALLFVLMDIAANTRRTREFVEGMGLLGQTLDNARTAVSQEGPEAPQPQPLTAEMRKQFAEQ